MVEKHSDYSPSDLDPKFVASLEHFKQHMRGLEEEVAPEQVPVRDDSIHRRLTQLLLESCDFCGAYEESLSENIPLLRYAQQYFREQTAPWMTQSWIGARARLKPSGFAGDFEMLIKLYEERTPAIGFGGYIDLCILELPLARAVRARLEAAKTFLVDEISRRPGGVRILDIASGPGREFNDWPELSTDNPVEIVALDNDPIAISHVQQNVAPHLRGGTKLNVFRYNALRTRNAKATIEKFGRFDIIYSVGLFDYLTDDHLVGMFAGLRDSLTNEGVLYIAFKDTERYDKTPYQWHLDWFFYQRTMQDVIKLYHEAGFETQAIETTRDATGIIINFISRHASSGIQRFEGEAGELRGPKTQPASVVESV